MAATSLSGIAPTWPEDASHFKGHPYLPASSCLSSHSGGSSVELTSARIRHSLPPAAVGASVMPLSTATAATAADRLLSRQAMLAGSPSLQSTGGGREDHAAEVLQLQGCWCTMKAMKRSQGSCQYLQVQQQPVLTVVGPRLQQVAHASYAAAGHQVQDMQ